MVVARSNRKPCLAGSIASASSLIEAVRFHLGAVAHGCLAARAASLRAVLEERLTDPRDRRGIRHSLPSLVSVLVAGGVEG